MRKIFGCIILICGMVAEEFFRNYHGAVIPWPWMWWIIASAILYLGGWMMLSESSAKRKAKRLTNKKRIDALKSPAKRIAIDSKICEVLAGYNKIIDTRETVIATNNGSELASLAFLPEEPATEEDVESCVIVCKTDFLGKEIKFVSKPIRKNRETVEFLIAGQKQIDLYVDQNDAGNYWFDLGFLSV
jgi:hypothetical protein